MNNFTETTFEISFSAHKADHERMFGVEHSARTLRLAKQFEEEHPAAGERTTNKLHTGINRHGLEEVRRISFTTNDRSHIAKVDKWLAGKDPLASMVVDVPADGRTVARAKYLPLEVSGSYVDVDPTTGVSINQYEPRCARCNVGDFNHVPNPLQVISERVGRAGQDIFRALNGIFIVRPAAFDMLAAMLGSNIATGEVVAQRGGERLSDLRWMRPSTHTGDIWGAYPEMVCPTCEHPVKRRRSQRSHSLVVESYGDAEMIALVGEQGYSNVKEFDLNRPQPHHVVLESKMFNQLWSHKVRGMAWPSQGAVLSLRQDERPLHHHPQVGDLSSDAARRLLARRSSS